MRRRWPPECSVSDSLFSSVPGRHEDTHVRRPMEYPLPALRARSAAVDPGADLRVSGDSIAGPAGVEILDVRNHLVPDRLHGLVTGPRDVGRHVDVRAVENPEQRIVTRWRFGHEAIEPDPRDLTLIERVDEIGLVDEAAAAAIDQQWPLLHLRELRRGDHI